MADDHKAPAAAAAAPPAAGGSGGLMGGLLGVVAGGLILVLALFAMVNYLALRHYQRFDWTGSKLYTLSEKSENVLKDLQKDIELVVVLNPGSQNYTAVDELLDRYVAANPQRISRRDLDAAASAAGRGERRLSHSREDSCWRRPGTGRRSRAARACSSSTPARARSR